MKKSTEGSGRCRNPELRGERSEKTKCCEWPRRAESNCRRGSEPKHEHCLEGGPFSKRETVGVDSHKTREGNLERYSKAGVVALRFSISEAYVETGPQEKFPSRDKEGVRMNAAR